MKEVSLYRLESSNQTYFFVSALKNLHLFRVILGWFLIYAPIYDTGNYFDKVRYLLN